jgi:hypothetical protein
MHAYAAGELFLEIIQAFNSTASITHQATRLYQLVAAGEEVTLVISKDGRDIMYFLQFQTQWW